MTFDDWKASFDLESAGNPSNFARLWNLTHETRIPTGLVSFRNLVVDHYKAVLLAGSSRPASDALIRAISECVSLSSHWLGLLPSTSKAHLGGPTAELVTNLRARDIARSATRTIVDEDNPPLQVRIHPPGATFENGLLELFKRFVWVTWESTGNRLPDDPTLVKKELGLDHFPADGYIFRCSINTTVVDKFFTPTCLDAGLCAAWAPPLDPSSHWGMTRDLVDGSERWPELLVETADVAKEGHYVAKLISPAASRQRTQPFSVDYLARRT